MAPRIPRTAPDIHGNRDNGALSKFDISNNDIVSYEGGGKYNFDGLRALAVALRSMSSLLELSIASNNLQVEGAQILVPVLQDNGVMSILDVSNNNIRAEGARALAPAM